MPIDPLPLPNLAQAALPLTYADLECLDDMTAGATETTSDLQALEQDVYHVLIETPGSNIDDTTRGIGVEGLLSGDASKLVGVAQTIETQLGEDPRINTVIATISVVRAGATWPDGSLAPDGGYLLELDIEASSGTLGLAYTFNPSSGLVPL